MTTLTIDRSSLAGHSDAEARGYAAFVADYLTREVGGEHRVRLGDGDVPEGYRAHLRDAAEEWAGLSAADHATWTARG